MVSDLGDDRRQGRQRKVSSAENSRSTLQHPIVSIIVERVTGDGPEILIQRRRKQGDPYDGVLELPQGGIEQQESLFEAAARELLEETGMRLRSLQDNRGHSLSVSRESHAFRPLACVHDVQNDFIGIAFVGQADGSPRDTPEADRHHWINVRELPAMLERERIFPLNLPMIQEYIRTASTSPTLGADL